MSDLTCKKCGEPFSVYYLRHERDDNAYSRMMSGEGCPACDWGDDDARDIWDEGNEQHHLKTVFNNTDDDPTKFL